MPALRSRSSRAFRCRSTAGRATTSAASRATARTSAAAWPSPATTPARPAPPTNCARRREGAVAHPRHAPLQPPRQLRGSRPKSRAQRGPARTLQPVDRLGTRTQARPRLQPDLLRPPARGRRLHPRPAGRRHPPVLDRARHRLPADRRGLRRTHRHALRHQRLDSRRLQGHADRPQGPARAAGAVARRNLRRADRPAAQPRRGRGKLFGIGSESYVVGSHEFYLGYAVRNRKTALPRRRPLPPDRRRSRTRSPPC